MGREGVQALDQFVRDGGTLVCLNGSSNFAIAQLKLPVKNVATGVRGQQFFASGSLLQVTTDPAHPLMAGMAERAAVFFDDSPIFVAAEGFSGRRPGQVPDPGNAAALRVPARREGPARAGRGARRAPGQRARRADRLPAAVARPAVRHVPRALQRGALSRRRGGGGERHARVLVSASRGGIV